MDFKDIIAIFSSREKLQPLSADQMNAIMGIASFNFEEDGKISVKYGDDNWVISHELSWDGNQIKYWVARRVSND